jgi:hypothetical protein
VTTRIPEPSEYFSDFCWHWRSHHRFSVQMPGIHSNGQKTLLPSVPTYALEDMDIPSSPKKRPIPQDMSLVNWLILNMVFPVLLPIIWPWAMCIDLFASHIHLQLTQVILWNANHETLEDRFGSECPTTELLWIWLDASMCLVLPWLAFIFDISRPGSHGSGFRSRFAFTVIDT